MPATIWPPLTLYAIDHRADTTPFVSAPHRHDHYELFYFLRGHGVHHIDFNDYPLTDHSAFLVSRRQVHYLTAPPGAHNVGWVLSFGPAFFDQLAPLFGPLFGSFTQSPVYSLAGTGHELDAAWFARLADELATPQPHGLLVVGALTSILLAYLSRQATPALPKSARPYEAVSRAFTAALETHLARFHSVTEYANLLHTTPRQLNRACRRIRDQSALATIHERLYLEARRWLYRTDLPVKEIAYELGFQDPAYFSAFFKRLSNGLSPETFRAALAQIHQQ